MLVARRLGLEVDERRAAGEDAIFTGHEPSFERPASLARAVIAVLICTIMHVLGMVYPRHGNLFHDLGARTAPAKSTSVAKVTSGASRCGWCPAPGIRVTSTGQ